MQTLAEKNLIQNLSIIIRQARKKENKIPRLLNIGAGTSVVVESELAAQGLVCLADRIDVEACQVSHPFAGNFYTGSIESMPMIKSATYKAAYANFVFEHIASLSAAAKEIHRILAPSGSLVVSIPNPSAPEFRLGRYTALWFRRIIRKKQAWETYYRYKDIADFLSIFSAAGFACKSIQCYPSIYSYLSRYPLIGSLASIYDKCLIRFNAKKLMGHACIVFKKTGNALK